MMFRRTMFVVLSVTAGLSFAACGGGGNDNTPTDRPPSLPPTTTTIDENFAEPDYRLRLGNPDTVTLDIDGVAGGFLGGIETGGGSDTVRLRRGRFAQGYVDAGSGNDEVFITAASMGAVGGNDLIFATTDDCDTNQAGQQWICGGSGTDRLGYALALGALGLFYDATMGGNELPLLRVSGFERYCRITSGTSCTGTDPLTYNSGDSQDIFVHAASNIGYDRLNLGGGNDQMTFRGGDRLAVSGGAGDDTFILESGTIAAYYGGTKNGTLAVGEAEGGADADTFEMRGGRVSGNILGDSAAGKDTLKFTAGTIGGFVDAGAGDDEVIINTFAVTTGGSSGLVFSAPGADCDSSTAGAQWICGGAGDNDILRFLTGDPNSNPPWLMDGVRLAGFEQIFRCNDAAAIAGPTSGCVDVTADLINAVTPVVDPNDPNTIIGINPMDQTLRPPPPPPPPVGTSDCKTSVSADEAAFCPPDDLTTPELGAFAAPTDQNEAILVAVRPEYVNTNRHSVDLPAPPSDLGMVDWTKLHFAHHRGATGHGVTIGIIDAGFLNTADEQFTTALPGSKTRTVTTPAGDTDSVTITVNGVDYPVPLTARNPDRSFPTHGTQVAVVAAAADNEKPACHPTIEVCSTLGVAPESNIIYRYNDIDYLFLTKPVTEALGISDADFTQCQSLGASCYLGELDASVTAQLTQEMIAAGAAVINRSFVYGIVYAEPGLRRGYIFQTVGELMEEEPARRTTIIEGNYDYEKDALAQAGTDDADKTLIVNGAANDAQPHPAASSAMMVFYPELRGHFITAVALNPEGNIWKSGEFSGSNHCGIAGPWCIAAPGQRVAARYDLTATQTGGDAESVFALVTGTSFAAPIVTGALAVLIDFFRDPGGDGTIDHGNTEIAARMLATADRTGIYAPDSIYATRPDSKWVLSSDCDNDPADTAKPDCLFSSIFGMGSLDLDAATRPFDTLRTAFSSLGKSDIASADWHEFSQSLVRPSPLLAAGLARALAGKQAVVFDALDFAFPYPAELLASGGTSRTSASLPQKLAGLANSPPNAYGTYGRLSGTSSLSQGRDNAPYPLFAQSLLPPALQQAQSLFAAPMDYFSLVRSGAGWAGRVAAGGYYGAHYLGLALAEGRAEDGSGQSLSAAPEARLLALSYGYAAPSYSFALRGGLVEEQDTLLGAFPGALYALNRKTRTFFAGLAAAAEFGQGWQAFVDMEAGLSEDSGSANGAFAARDLLSARARAGLWRPVGAQSWLALMAEQPLYLAQGEGEIAYACGRTAQREFIMCRDQFSLAGDNQVDLQLAYGIKLSAQAQAAFAAGTSSTGENWTGFALKTKF